jgi:cyclic 2,3-diphosphoglycerate synthetase
VKAVALVDGEHAPAVVREALEALPYEWVGAILVGGSEKLRGVPDYGVPLLDSFDGAEVAVDLSDEPVLDPAGRMRWASRALAAGLSYVGADFRFDPPRYEAWERPPLSIAVIGTGKRVGKTTVAGHLARLLAREQDVVVVAMGRGGPSEPEVVSRTPSVEELVALSRNGRHAASDHLETAAIYGVPTIGCRRTGGGLAGQVFVSNVREGARLAAARDPDVVVLDSSGTAIPPLEVDRRVLVVGPDADLDEGFDLYRRLVSDLVVSVGRERAGAFSASFRLRPLEPVQGRVAVFTAGGTDVDLDAEVVQVSPNLGDRQALAADLERVDADTYLVELKGAAIDVVAEHALERGRRIVLAANDVVAPELDAALLALVPASSAAA